MEIMPKRGARWTAIGGGRLMVRCLEEGERRRVVYSLRAWIAISVWGEDDEEEEEAAEEAVLPLVV